MTIHDVFPGRTYAVSSAEGCAVSTLDGVALCTAQAGQQAFFVAPCAKVQVSDDAALITQAFNLAPGMLPGAGGSGGSFEPAGDYLLIGDNFSSVEGRLDSVTNANYLFYNRSIKSFDIPMPNVVRCIRMFQMTSSLTRGTFNFPKAEFCDSMCYMTCLDTATFNLPSATSCDSMCYGSHWLQRATFNLSSAVSCISMCKECKLDVASVESIANTIATWTSGTHLITIGMAKDLKGTEGIANALAAIRAKGWTVTEEYN